ncbi:Hsp70 family protein [Rhodococcus spelaei]|uniref:Hsp70 family protein n=1 Tax=Rhodococcus spelaei TaxID=2546320 RepID=A0A541BQI3_9NOCA|nr:Hsp70 family protein [Rhodococcus spelaei]TQF74603.1 Hsp70 family protein [Rhodococcus spelaei]
MSSREWVLGIDFGTSNTAAAHTGPVSGSVESLQLSHNRTTMSSAVFVESPDRIEVGDVATDRAESNPAAFMPSPKRVIAQGMVNVNGYDMPASVPVAAVLDSVMSRATGAHGGKAPAELVLTHPEAWSPREIQVLLDAAAQLGLDASKITTVSEPRAAAHYYTRANTLAPGARIAVFDFGGGTLDIAVLEANEAGTFDIVAARGDNGLGGKNLDAYLRRWVDQQLDVRDPEMLGFLRTRAPMDVRYALDDSIRRAKELLSEAPSATITVTGEGRTEKFQITREEFEELITPTLDKATALTRATLADAHITAPDQLEALYLTGGSSRIPLVHERLAELGPIATLDDPKTVVAQGALAAAAPIVRGLGGTPAAAPAAPAPATAPIHPPQTASQPWAPQAGTPNTAHGGWQQPTTTAGAGAGSKKKWGLVAAAAVVVLAVGGGVAAFALKGGGDNPPRNAAATELNTAGAQGTDATSSGDPALSGDSSAGTPPTTKETVVAALPPALRSELDACKTVGETENGGMKLNCPIKKGSALTAGVFTGDYASVIVSVDTRAAKKSVTGLRQGVQNDTAVADNVLVENTARTAAAHIDGPIGENSYSFTYANSSTGVMASSTTLKGLDGAKTFLTRAGLIN